MSSRLMTLSVVFFASAILSLVLGIASSSSIHFELGRGLMVVLVALSVLSFGAHLLRGRAAR